MTEQNETLGALGESEAPAEVLNQSQSEGIESIEAEESAQVEQPAENKENADPDGFVKRINKITAQKRQTEQLLMQEQQRNMLMQQQLQQYLSQQQAAQPQVDPYAPKPPNKQDYVANPLDYAEALANFHFQSNQYNQAKFQQQQKQVEKQRLERDLDTTYSARLQAEKEAHPDFDECLENLQNVAARMDPRLVEDLVFQLKAMENGPSVIRHLSKNLSDFEQLGSLDSRVAAIKLAEIGARLKPPAKKLSSSPPPPKQLSGTSAKAMKEETIDSISKRIASKWR